MKLLSTAYFPNVNYFKHLTSNTEIYIEHSEYYARHSFRNKTQILGSNGTLFLTVPIKKKNLKL